MARQYWNVLGASGQWETRKVGQAHGQFFATQQEAIDSAAFQASSEHIRTKGPTGVRIQGQDGQWSDERSYGDDPIPPRG